VSTSTQPITLPAAIFPANPCASLVRRVQVGDTAATEELYGALRSFRGFLHQNMGPEDAEDTAQDLFLAVWQAVQGGVIRDPGRLFGYAKTVLHRQVARRITDMVGARRCCGCEDVVLRDSSPNPEQAFIRGEAVALAHRALASLPANEREILRRSYLLEEPNAQIIKDLSLTETKYRNAKHRAKSQLANRFSRVTRSFRPKIVEISGIPDALSERGV
jgi:RNA polymerase sigma factor (sigma-70 family)